LIGGSAERRVANTPFPKRRRYFANFMKKRYGNNESSSQDERQAFMDPGAVLDNLIADYTSKKQTALIQMKKGLMSKEGFLKDVQKHITEYYPEMERDKEAILNTFEEYIFGYSRLSSLIDDASVSDIRVISHNNIQIKREGKRMNSGVFFRSEAEYRQFVHFVATKNQVSISNLNAIQRFTDTDSHAEFILRFTITMPLVNTYNEPYLCVRKVPKNFPDISTLVNKKMMKEETAELLQTRFSVGSTLICGGNSSGKTTLLNALKETLPPDMAVLVTQQADELTTKEHPDMMFLHSLPGTGESQVSYDLESISIAGLTMDVDFFIIGEVKGAEAMYLLNAAYTGQICAATIHAPSADKAVNKLVDYAMYDSRYSRNELMKMMDCFKTVIFLHKYQVDQVYEITGWEEERKELGYRILYQKEEQG